MDIVKKNDLYIFSDPKALFEALVLDFMYRAQTAIEIQGIFRVVLPGGNTPKLFFDTLVEMASHEKKIAWHKIIFFFGDERYVPKMHVDNNYHMAYEHLFSKLPIDPNNIHRILTEFKNAHDAAKDYEETLRTIFHCHPNEFPHFDLIYLGLGEDAHTASLMPLTDLVIQYAKSDIQENYQLVAAVWLPEQNKYRITLTPSIINQAESIVFMVTGLNKALAVYKTLKGSYHPQQIPAQLIHCIHNPTVWFLDKDAAREITIRS